MSVLTNWGGTAASWDAAAQSAGFMHTDDYMNSTNWLGISKADNPFSKGNLTGLFSKEGLGNMVKGALPSVGMGVLNMGVNMLAGQNHSAVGDVMQTVGGLASNIPGVGGLIGGAVGVVGGLVNAAFGSHINEEFVNQTQNQANQIGSNIFNANTNADLLNDWGNLTEQSHVYKDEVGSDGWFSSKASRRTAELNARIDEANRRQLANFNVAAENVDTQNDFRIMQNMAAYGGPIGSFRRFYANGGSLFDTPEFFTFEPQTYDKGGYLNQAKALIRENEGWSAKPYADSPKGKNWRSVGYGFNDSGFRDKYPEGISKHYEHGITKKQAEEELDYFLKKAEKQLKSIYGKQWDDFSDSQKAAILDTYYQRPASVGKSSRFYKAVTAGEDASRYLGVAGYSKRNNIRQSVFGGTGFSGGAYEDNSESLSYPSPILEATSPISELDLSGIKPTKVINPEINLSYPSLDLNFLTSSQKPIQQQVPTVGTVEDFLASYGDFEQNLFSSRLNNEDMSIFDFGGWLSHTHGSDFDSGLDFVAEGNSHEQNPFGGVMVGQDGEGTPNLVEEGEYIWNGDYVFSRRMKVPKKLREKYNLSDDATFADAVKKLTKESEERPLDIISRNTQDHILGELADSQEEMRMAKAQRKMEKEQQLQDDFLTGVQFGLGGHMTPMGLVPNEDNTSFFELLNKQFAEGGDIHIDPSKRGTFKAQASKMGMGVQEAASHILANKENYSPAMVKKAVFAHNFAHADGGDLFSDPFGEPSFYANTFDWGGDLRAKRDKVMKDNGLTEEQANIWVLKQLSGADRGKAIKSKVFGDWYPTYNSNGELVETSRRTAVAPNRGTGNGQGSQSTQAAAKKSGAGQKAAVTKPSVGSTGLNTYKYDPIETFKYWDKDNADYDEGYRDFIENKLNKDWITRVMNGQYGDMSRYKGANKVNPTVEQAWQLGLDKKNSDWHKAMAAAYDEYQKGIDPKTGKVNTPAVEWPDENWEFDPYSEGWEARRGISTEPVTTKPVDSNTGITKSPFKPKQTWTRYAPIAMNALFGLKEMLTPADYGNADAIMAAAYQAGSPVSIGTEYIGDYRKRDPFDETYLMNIINQNSRAANRNFMNISGGNRAAAMSGILANDLVTQRSLAEAARQAYLANRTDDAQVAEFNRGTNIFNAQAQNQRNQFLAQLNSQRQNAMLSGIAQGARLRQAIKDQRDAAISANLTAFAQGLGDLGKENSYYNMLGGLNEEGVLKYFYRDDWKTKFNNVNG